MRAVQVDALSASPRPLRRALDCGGKRTRRERVLFHQFDQSAFREQPCAQRLLGLRAASPWNRDSARPRLQSLHDGVVTDLTYRNQTVREQLREIRPHALDDHAIVARPAGKGDKRIEALRIAEIFRAQVVDTSTEHFVFEVTGKPSKLEQFIQIMTELGLVEVSRTGIAAIGRGPASV